MIRLAEDPDPYKLSTGWTRKTTLQLPEGDLRRWYWARDWLKHPLAELIHQRRLPLPPGSPLARERQWLLARRVMQLNHKPYGPVIALPDLREAVDVMMQTVQGAVHATWAGGGMTIDSHDIRWLHAHLEHQTGELIHPPWPGNDLPFRGGVYWWQMYSPELTQEVMTGILRDAVTGYKDLVDQNFARFGWALGLNSVLPARVEGEVIMPDSDPEGRYSLVVYELKPDHTASRNTPPEVQLDLLTRRRAIRPDPPGATSADLRGSPFHEPVRQNTMPMTGQVRPATNLAYRWLASDLHALGWLDHAPFFLQD